MRRPSIAAGAGLLVVLAAGLGLLAWRATVNREVDPVLLGILADHHIGELGPGEEACQRPVDLDRRVSALGLAVDTGGNAGPPLSVELREYVSGEVLSRAKIPGGYVLGVPEYYGLRLRRPVEAGQSIRVCARNEGRTKLILVGSEAQQAQGAAVDDERGLAGDWAVFFPYPDRSLARTHLEMVPDMVERASVMRPGLVTPLTYGLLAVVLLVGCPLLLWRAATRASGADADR